MSIDADLVANAWSMCKHYGFATAPDYLSAILRTIVERDFQGYVRAQAEKHLPGGTK